MVDLKCLLISSTHSVLDVNPPEADPETRIHEYMFY